MPDSALKEEGFSAQEMILGEYQRAAEKIRSRGEIPTAATLAAQLMLPPDIVSQFLEKRPDIVSGSPAHTIGPNTDTAAKEPVMDTVELREVLAALTDDQRSLMVFIAKDYRDDEALKELSWPQDKQYNEMCSLFERFNLPKNSYEASREMLARIGRENGFLTPAAHSNSQNSSAGDSAGTSGQNEEEHSDKGETPSGLSKPSSKSSAAAKLSAADFEAKKVAEKIGALSKEQVELLEFSLDATKGDGAREAKAKEFGITTGGLASRLNKIFSILEMEQFPGRKRFLQECMAEYKKARKKATARVVEEKPGVVETDPEITLPAPISQPQAPQAHATQAAPHYNAPAAAVSGQGPGVAIPLPANLADADVLSGQFNGTHPAAGLTKQIRSRKEGGFKPAFLVIAPTNDPAVSQAQMVFFKFSDEEKF